MPIVRKISPGEAAVAVAPPALTALEAQALPAPAQPANILIVWVDIDVPRPAPWNPARRVSRAALRPLLVRMEQEGFEPFRPLLLSHDGIIGDGHRRWAVARLLGLPRVPVVYTDKTVEELWAGNMGARVPMAKEWMAVAVQAGVAAPPRVADMVNSLRMILGDEGLSYLIQREQSPGIWNMVWKIGQYCGRSDNTFLRKTTYWLIKHAMQDKVSKAMRADEAERVDPATLIQAIEHDLPLRSRWDIYQTGVSR